ncbi:hypothetical protein COU17_02330 [Candidatus Kaiserbacteria bacterium CG10_big_fil_rev_8_21_14_0_10_49_17]|uniref:Major facilitator superfamily (MFS) profile domain-containing protein n=1 Tax=Candidatus Kaiserbacteria bacterium CG10_big_fil_rev_8_21_14_0_10_49_17 TaxID=1974609 RepID=A0A2M6WED6_9BACT|nr:MAG: hypothetical protein COU17_02330 [Candidatus Kaiserbacteria bacterium CG10_big_fil_rev_8_21_14_0_10_49_17]
MKIALSDLRDIHFSTGTKALCGNRLLMQLGFGMVSIFAPVFFYLNFGHSFAVVAFVYITLYTLHLLFTPLAALLFRHFSLKRLMLFAVPLALVGMLALALFEYGPWFFVTVHIFLIAVYKALYWVPYHVDFSLFANATQRGKQMSILLNLSSVIAVATPLIAGVIIATFGFSTAFAFSAVFFAISMVPLLSVPPTREVFEYSFLESFRKLFSKEHRPILLGYVGDGAQTVVTAVIWPVFIFLLLDQQYVTAGFVTGITIVAIMAIRFVTGNLFDRWSKEKTLTWSAVLLATGWIVKVFVESAFQIFLVDTYHQAGRAMSRVSIDATTYEQAADNGHYVDEFTVLKEMSLNIGRILMLALIAFTVAVASIKIAFIAAALAALMVTVLNKRIHVSA